jgi:hypothetical protein
LRPYQSIPTIGVLSLILLLAPAAPGDTQEAYVSQEIVRASWGGDPGEFGLLEQAEGVGPQSLCLDSQGNIFVLDLVHRRVQVFSPQGNFQRQTSFDIMAHDLCLNQDGELFLLAPYHGLVDTYDPRGHRLARLFISPQIQLIDGIRTAENRVVLRTAGQVEHALTGTKGPLSPEAQLEAVQPGMSGPDPSMRYRTEWVDDHLGLVQLLDGNGQEIQEIRVVTREVLASLIFVGADGAGNIYLRAEILGPEATAQQKIFKYDPQGSIQAEFALPTSDFTFIYRNLHLTRNGDVFQLLTGPDGVRVLRWQATSQNGEGR